MGALFSSPKAPPPPPPPPNPQTAANASQSFSSSAPAPGAGAAGGTLLTSAAGAQETKTAGKALMGQ